MDIIDKIQHLLSKTTEAGATPQEAASAIALAHKLMAKHNISVSQLSTTKSSVEEHSPSLKTKSVSKYHWTLGKALAPHFGCRVFIRGIRSKGQSLCFVGDSKNVQALLSCFNFAFNSYQYYYDKYSKTHEASPQLRWDYFNGFVDGVTNELIKSESESALVICESQEVADYFNKLSMKVNKVKWSAAQDSSARLQGYTDGSYSTRSKSSLQE